MAPHTQRTRCLLSCRFWGFAFLAVLATGCGAKGNNATLSGKVTYHDVPVTGGEILLHPEKGGVPYPIAIKNDGTFNVSGAPVGKFKVTVQTESVKNVGKGYDDRNIKLPAGTPRPQKPTSSDQPVYVKVPTRYAQVKTTPLTWDIEKGKQEKTITLTDK